MKKIKLGALVVLLLASSGWAYHSNVKGDLLRTVNVQIEKDKENKWRVRDNNGRNQGSMRVEAGDKINWHAKVSDVVFIFSKDVNDYFEFDEGLFADGRTQKIDKNKKLRVTLKKDAPTGELPYEVYVMSEGRSVIGNSPPKLIVF